MKHILLIGAALGVYANSVVAQKEQPLPKELPPYGADQPLRGPEVRVTTLPNGLTVWAATQPGLPKVAVALTTIGGLATDPTELPGLSELLASTITQGTATRSAHQVAQQMQAVGGDLTATADAEATTVSTTVLSESVGQALSLVADVVQHATFPDSEVAIAKRNLASSLEEREATPDFQRRRVLAKVLFGTSPYNIVGPTNASIAVMTPAALRAEYVRRFRPDQSLLVLVGDIKTDVVSSLVRDKLGAWTNPAGAPEMLPPAPKNAPQHAIYVVPRAGSVQTTLALGVLAPAKSQDDYAATELATTIYGGSFSSRLMANIREDKGYTYSPYSNLQALRSVGSLRTVADVRNAVTGPALNEILYELNRMATTSPTDRELALAKRYRVGLYATLFQSRSLLASQLAANWVLGLPSTEIELHAHKVAAATLADVDAAARKYFPASLQTIIAVGEDSVVRSQLSPFGLPMIPAP